LESLTPARKAEQSFIWGYRVSLKVVSVGCGGTQVCSPTSTFIISPPHYLTGHSCRRLSTKNVCLISAEQLLYLGKLRSKFQH